VAHRWPHAGRTYAGCDLGLPLPQACDGWADAVVAGTPFWLPAPSPPMWGVPCQGQLVATPPGRWEWLHLLLAEDAIGGELELWLHYRSGAVDPEWLHRAPDGATARVPVTRPEPLAAVRLPDRPELRLVAVTLASPPARQQTGRSSS
jgi:hypothetical protein